MIAPTSTVRPITAVDPDPRNASISVRDYIYFLPYPMPAGAPVPYTLGLPNANPLGLPPQAFEPTHTLVLTSMNKTFVDIRIFRPFRPNDPELPNTGGPRDRLEWAFSGTSTSHVIPDPVRFSATPSNQRVWAGPIKKASWTHWLDSRHHVDTPTHQIPGDSGIMFPVNDVQTLEHGAGMNVYNGQMQSYEEMWTELNVEACWPKKEKVSLVMKIDVPGVGVRGCAVRLGRYCQAVMMIGDVVTVERWEFKNVGGGKGNGKEKTSDTVSGEEEKWQWKKTVRIGDAFLPCPLMCQREDELLLGGLVKYGDFEWRIEEKVEWEDVEEFV